MDFGELVLQCCFSFTAYLENTGNIEIYDNIVYRYGLFCAIPKLRDISIQIFVPTTKTH